MNNDELKNAPKLLCENISMAFTAEYFVMGLRSGTQATVYSLSPQHAKRLQQYLAYKVSEYEAQHGAITAEWNPNIVSPIQNIDKKG